MVPVKYVLIGFGGIAENRIAREGFACDRARFKPLEHALLTGATDLNPARRAAAEALGLKWYDSAEAVLADPEVEAVYVATNNATHAALSIRALEAGKHVICEKPMATTLRDAEKMIKTASSRRLSLSVDHMMVNNAFNRLAKKAIASDRIGTVNDARIHMECLYGATPAEAASWRCSRVEEMGGPVGDMASHCFYMAEFLFGSPIVSVRAVYLPKTLPIRAEEGAYIKYTLENGLTGSVQVSFGEPRGGLIGTFGNLGYEIYGGAGALRGYGTMFQISGHADEPYRIRLEVETAQGVRALRPRKFPNIYQTLIEKHALSIRKQAPVNAEEGLRNLRIVSAAHRSARAGGKACPVV